MTGVSTHVLDTASGRPAAAVAVSLQRRGEHGSWQSLGAASTDADGRARPAAGTGAVEAGVHRLVFATGDYLREQGTPPFFEEVIVTFTVTDERHLHVPLLLSPYGYSVYRGS